MMLLRLLCATAGLVAIASVNLAAQTPAAGSDQPSSSSAPTPVSKESDAEYEMFEFTETELPQYDEAALARLIVYPEDARKNGVEGTVLVGFVVTTAGRADKLEIVSSDNAIFNATSLEAIRNMTFRPATQEGKPVRVRMVIPIRYTMK